MSSAVMSTTLRSPNRQLTCATSPSSQRSAYIGCTACDISTPPPPRGVASQVWTVGGRLEAGGLGQDDLADGVLLQELVHVLHGHA